MNQNKFCFIMCVTDAGYLEECFRYIHHLHVPAGYETDAITIQDAASVAAGYNAGMRETDAKYKIYLRQTTLIVNRNFLSDLLRVFEEGSIGMLGVMGSPRVPEHGRMEHGERIGSVYRGNLLSADAEIRGKKGLYEVEAVDGMLMATQYDVPWREDLFDGDCYYDVAQSLEFRRRGYRVAVPRAAQPWCICDQAFYSGGMEPEARKRFLAEYANDLRREGV